MIWIVIKSLTSATKTSMVMAPITSCDSSYTKNLTVRSIAKTPIFLLSNTNTSKLPKALISIIVLLGSMLTKLMIIKTDMVMSVIMDEATEMVGEIQIKHLASYLMERSIHDLVQ